jgi:DNA-binding NarL/FixJ family response regulator
MAVIPRLDGPPESATPHVRVAIVDDHPLMREGLRHAFEPSADISVVGEAGTAREALEMATASEPDVILLDFRLPDADGVTVLKQLREQGCTAHVVMLTCVSDQRCVRSAIDNGACGFLTKSTANRAALCEAVRNASRGLSAVSPDALTSLLDNVREDCPDHVTAREEEVWRLVASGMTNAEIAQALFLSERTVKFHVGNILRKTASRSRAEAVSLAFTCGLMNRDA